MNNKTSNHIKVVCAEIRDLLLEKNEKYGDSALSPEKIFSKADAYEALNVRIDDKLRRIKHTPASDDTEDAELDLIGYLILRRVYRRANDKAQAYPHGEKTYFATPEEQHTIVENFIKDSYA